MIVTSSEKDLLVVTQNDHAHFSGELLSLWHREPLRSHPRRDDLLFAAREHDNGWREADSAPRHDTTTGQPHTFLTMPEAVRREIWELGIHRFAEERPYASLLILRHALHLYRHHRDDPSWHPTLNAWDALEAEWLGALGLNEETLAKDYGWIDLSDHLSLASCNNWTQAVETRGHRFQVGSGVLQVSPFPLAGATTFRIPCRRIPSRPYRSDSDLAIELATARWDKLEVRVQPFANPLDRAEPEKATEPEPKE